MFAGTVHMPPYTLPATCVFSPCVSSFSPWRKDTWHLEVLRGAEGVGPRPSRPPLYPIILCLRAPTSNTLQIRSTAAARRRLQCRRGLKPSREGFPSEHTHDRCGEKTHTRQIGVLVQEQRGNVNRLGWTVSHQLIWRKHAELRNQQF